MLPGVHTHAVHNTDQTVTLLHMRDIGRYNDWVFSYLAPHIRGRVLEVGCGIGTYSVRLREHAAHLTCVDMVPTYAAEVRQRLAGYPHSGVVLGMLGGGLAFRPASFDTIVCLNVIEHVEDDHGALKLLHSYLAPGGCLLVQVPAHQWLFGSIDACLGHYRRYTARSLREALRQGGFAIELEPTYLYALAIPGWWLIGRVARRRAVPEASVRIANVLAALSRAIESVIRPPFGLTVLAVGRVSERG